MGGLGPAPAGQQLTGVSPAMGAGTGAGGTLAASQGSLAAAAAAAAVAAGAGGLRPAGSGVAIDAIDFAQEANKRRRMEEVELEKKFQEQIVRRRYVCVTTAIVLLNESVDLQLRAYIYD